MNIPFGMNSYQDVSKDLHVLGDPSKAIVYQKFFRTGKGEYAEGDKFLGITVPEQRKIVRKYRELPLSEVVQLLQSVFHEERLVALLILVAQFDRALVLEKEKIYHIYMSSMVQINNWDLVDCTAPRIVGVFLLNRDRSLLYELAQSTNLWYRRISIIATWAFIRSGQFDDTLAICELLMSDKHDLIHKACGWMLREVGKKKLTVLENFLNQYAATMPRTMLRYSLEKMLPTKRKYYMKLKELKVH